MSDIYINATLFETKLRDAYYVAMMHKNYDAVILYRQLIDILKSETRFQQDF